MKKSNLLKRVSAMVMIFAMIFGVFGMSGSTIKVNAATEKVKMYYFDRHQSQYGFIMGFVYIQINDSASNKAVYAHHVTNVNGQTTWIDTPASYVTTLSDGSQIWRAEIGEWGLQYAIKYVGNGQTYWDNNNGNNYTPSDRLGSAPFMVDRLGNQEADYSYSNYKIQATLKNLADTKVVKVRYTEDNWATYQDVALSYVSSDTSKGIEVWSTNLPLNINKKDSFHYCLYYQVNGQTYWDNNFGSNYDIGFHIYN